MERNRLLDYFVVYGFNPSLAEEAAETHEVTHNLDYVTRLELVVTPLEGYQFRSETAVDYLLIGQTTGKKLWLKVVYGRKGSFERGGTPLKDMMLYYADVRGKAVVVPGDFKMIPVHLGERKPSTSLMDEIEGNLYYYGNYDLTDFLGAKPQNDKKLILAYSLATLVEDMPIIEISLKNAENDGEGGKIFRIPMSYTAIDFLLGCRRVSVLIYKIRIDPFKLTYKPQLVEKFPREEHADLPLQAIHLFCFPDGLKLQSTPPQLQVFSFILTTDKGKRIYVTTLNFYEQASEAIRRHYNLSPDAEIYCPKALCLVSHWPYVEQFGAALKQIYCRSLSRTGVPIERLVYSLLQEVPLPLSGQTVVYEVLGKTLRFSGAPNDYLPMVPDISIELLFKVLPWSAVTTVITAVLVERKVLFVSSCKTLLTHMALAATALIYPFKWEQVLIPVLPMALNGYLQAPLPYIIGVAPEAAIDVPWDTVQVLLDQGKVVVEDPLPLIPMKLLNLLTSRLSKLTTGTVPACPENLDYSVASPELSEAKICSLKNAFLEFNCKLLKNYKRFYTTAEPSEFEISNFDMESFRSYKNANKSCSFVYQLTDSTHFTTFLEDKSESMRYFEAASRSLRAPTDVVFVKPFPCTEITIALEPNELGCDIGIEYWYDTFPKLNDDLFCDPRKIKQPQTPKSPLEMPEIIYLPTSDSPDELLACFYKLWICLFTEAMPYNREHAKPMMDLAICILNRMQASLGVGDIQVYLKLVEACGYCGLGTHIQSLLKKMKHSGLNPDALINDRYIKAVAQGFAGLDEPPKAREKILKIEDVILSMSTTCRACGYKLKYSDVVSMWAAKQTAPQCVRCKESSLLPQFTVIDSKRCSRLTIDFVCPEKILMSIAELDQQNILKSGFYEDNSGLYWNLVFLFETFKLPTFFLESSIDALRLQEVQVNFTRYPTRRRSQPGIYRKVVKEFTSTASTEYSSEDGEEASIPLSRAQFKHSSSLKTHRQNSSGWVMWLQSAEEFTESQNAKAELLGL